MNDESQVPPSDDDGSSRDIGAITIEEEMKTSYLDYAMSVIVSRALPDARDGLKPVHRRILYAMHESGYDASKPYRKSARIVGDVMGKYHPHGDQSIYDALVRLAQDFSMRLELIDGQGNFGSMDGDPPAAMRYTEARLSKAAGELLSDIGKDTVDFQANYDESEHEPKVLPARFPNLLVNGAGGIAVGMATNIPPHNLGEVIDACQALIEDPDIDILGLMEHVPGPDFPTGAIILGRAGIRSAYETGRGSIMMRSRTAFEEVRKDRMAIIVSEVPFQVNKSGLIEKIADNVRNKRIEGISDIRDESDRHGVRVVIELKRDAVPDVVLNQLYRHTQLQTSFGANMLAIDGGRPRQMNLKEFLQAFIAFREVVIIRRTKYELGKARERAHTLIGLVIAVANIDKVVAMIRGAKSPQDAREALLAEKWDGADVAPYIALVADPTEAAGGDSYRLTERQVKAILDLRLHRLTALGREEIGGELEELAEKIKEFLEILTSRVRLIEILTDELREVREGYATPRRTEIQDVEFGEFEDEDLIKREEMVVTVTHSGYIKRVPLSTYRAQRRGGKGRAGMSTGDEDFLTQVFVVSTHTPVLFFSTLGKVYKLKVWKLPLGTPQAKGKNIINILPLEQDEAISTILPLPENEDEWQNLQVMFATASGSVRRNAMDDFTYVPSNGKIAIKFAEDSGDRLVGVELCTNSDDVFLAARDGKSVRFPDNLVRQFKGRSSIGVRGMRLATGSAKGREGDDRVISMSILNGQDASVEEREAYLKAAAWKAEPQEPTLSADRMAELAATEQFILTVTEKGYGKRTSSHEYRAMGRGGQGVANIEVNQRNGCVVAAFPVVATDELMMVTDQGKIIRTPVAGVRIIGRGTQGVTLFSVADDEKIVSVAKLSEDEQGDGDEEGVGELASGADVENSGDVPGEDGGDA